MSRLVEEDAVVRELRKRVAKAGSQLDFAKEVGIAQGFISNVLRRIKSPSAKLLQVLGFEAQTMYRKTVGA